MAKLSEPTDARQDPAVSCDVFNGDADGIFALHQYRLKHPPAGAVRLITGVKRDIKLLDKIADISNSSIFVFDISMAANQSSLTKLINQNNQIVYFDHHRADPIQSHTNLRSFIDPSPNTCTSIIVSLSLHQSVSPWAIAAAFGDNIHEVAYRCGKESNLSEKDIGRLRELGELFNYNGYGLTPDDLHFHPAELYGRLAPYDDPLEFLNGDNLIETLREGYREDMEAASKAQQLDIPGPHRAYILDDAPWSRRVSGVFSNSKARERQHSAHAVITENSDGSLRVSVRAPLSNRRGADTLCCQFPTGGGRAAAAGINTLAPEDLDRFLEVFSCHFSSP